jgi:hypothetical protein
VQRRRRTNLNRRRFKSPSPTGSATHEAHRTGRELSFLRRRKLWLAALRAGASAVSRQGVRNAGKDRRRSLERRSDQARGYRSFGIRQNEKDELMTDLQIAESLAALLISMGEIERVGRLTNDETAAVTSLRCKLRTLLIRLARELPE